MLVGQDCRKTVQFVKNHFLVGVTSIVDDDDVEITLSVNQANQFDKIQIRLIGGDDKIVHNRSSFLEICCS